MRFIEYCHLHRILLAVYLPHSTYRLQPLDISLFSPLATYYSQELNQFTAESEGLIRLTKRDFFRLFWTSYSKAFSVKNIQSGWQKTGIHPFSPEAVLDKFLPKETIIEQRPSSSESSDSLLNHHDWQRIERKLKELVADVGDTRVRKLTSTIKNLAATNILLESRIKGYQQALKNEQKKRQRHSSNSLQLRKMGERHFTALKRFRKLASFNNKTPRSMKLLSKLMRSINGNYEQRRRDVW